MMRTMPVQRKYIIRIEIDGPVALALAEITEKRGMTQVSLVSRMVKWLARQDVETQTEILNGAGENSPKLLKLLASRAAKGK